MTSELNDAIRMLVQERGISEDLIRKTIEEFLLAAYKKKFGTSDNAVVQFSDEDGEVTLFGRKEIVEEVYDPVNEIDLNEAKEYDEEAEIGDELLIEIDPQEFDRVAVQSAKQKARQTLREIQKDSLYSEYIDKVGEMIIGYYQRERNGNIFVDLGKTEGLMPKRYQSPRESYRPNDRIKALIYEVNKTPTGLQIILSRTHTEFVKRVFELEVPEIYDQTVSVYKLVREPGYRTKIAVYSNREDVDPVGACVGLRGVRIQSIVRELEGEKIDILKYENDPRTFIKNALSPAEVSQVIILDESKKQALAVVPENQLSLAIGKQGLNVRLANRLADWSIDVKTEAQFAEMDIAAETKRAVSALFGEGEEEEEITRISELPGITDSLLTALKGNGLEYIEDLVSLSEDELNGLTGLDENDVKELKQIIADSVEIIEEQEEAEQSDAEAETKTEAGEEAPSEEAVAEETEPEEALESSEAPEVSEEPELEAEAPAETGGELEAEVAEEAETAEAAAASEDMEATEPDAEEEAAEQGAEVSEEARETFPADETSGLEEQEEEEEAAEITYVSELPSISEDLVEKLRRNNIEEVLDLLDLSEEELNQLEGFSAEDVAQVREIISENVEVIEQDEDE